MRQVYFDNASTSFPKPKAVADAMYSYLLENGCNINRGCYSNAYQIEDTIFECRDRINALFNGPDPRNVVFTKNVTESLNIVIKGIFKKGDHILVSSMEHNAIMRPLTQQKKNDISFSRIPCNLDGSLDCSSLENLITDKTKAVIMTHASNVCGTVMPIKEIGEFCKRHKLLFIVDCAQTAGILEIDIKKMNIDILAFTGHKGLMGPQGIGGFIISDELADIIDPLISGGTGSYSHLETIPNTLPDKLEAGTPNIPGIIGLNEGIKWITDKKIATIYKHEQHLTEYFLDKLKLLEEDNLVKIIGKRDLTDRIGVISIQTPSSDISNISYELDNRYGIMTRVGLHCAPSAHETLNTISVGTIRFSFGYFNTIDEIDYAIDAINILTKEAKNGF